MCLQMFLAMCPPQVSRCHMLEIVGVVASSIGIYYVPLQLMTIELCTLLAARDSGKFFSNLRVLVLSFSQSTYRFWCVCRIKSLLCSVSCRVCAHILVLCPWLQ